MVSSEYVFDSVESRGGFRGGAIVIPFKNSRRVCQRTNDSDLCGRLKRKNAVVFQENHGFASSFQSKLAMRFGVVFSNRYPGVWNRFRRIKHAKREPSPEKTFYRNIQILFCQKSAFDGINVFREVVSRVLAFKFSSLFQ